MVQRFQKLVASDIIGGGMILLAILMLSVAFQPGCVPPPANLTPEAASDFNKTRIIRTLDLLRETVVAANKEHVPQARGTTVRTVVLWHQSAVRTIDAMASGWAETVTTGLRELTMDLPPEEQKLLRPYVALAIVVINGVAHGG